MRTHTPLSRWIDEYLAVRRRAGFALKVEKKELQRFVRFTEAISHRDPLTVQLAARWANSSNGGRRLTAARRIEVIRTFQPTVASLIPQPKSHLDDFSDVPIDGWSHTYLRMTRSLACSLLATSCIHRAAYAGLPAQRSSD